MSARTVIDGNYYDPFVESRSAWEPYYQQALQGQAAILSQRFHKYLLPIPPTVANSTLMHMQQTVRVSPMMDSDQVCGTLTLIEDVTERVLNEQELRLQAEPPGGGQPA